MNNDKHDLTQGSIWKKLLYFALPLLGASLIQQLYNTVDILFVGNLIGKEASAAVGASSMLATALIGFFSGISVGAGVVISQAFGAKDSLRLSRSIHTAITLGLFGGIILTTIGLIGAPTFMRWMGTPENIMRPAVSYVRIYFLSMTSMLVYNMSAGIMRALGNSGTPMWIQLIGGIVNVAADALFIAVFDNPVDGVAWATVFSQAVSALLSAGYLIKSGVLSLKELSVSRDIFGRILSIGVPAGIQSFVITLSNIFVQFHINSFDVDCIAAFTAYFKIELIVYLPIVALGQSVMTFVGQNIGVGNKRRAADGVSLCLTVGTLYAIASSVLVYVFGDKVFYLFNQDAGVIDSGLKIISITLPWYCVYVFLETYADALRGAGKSLAPMVIILTSLCALRIGLMYLLMSYRHDIELLVSVYPITWIAAAAALGAVYYKERWNCEDGRTSNKVLVGEGA